MEIITVQISDIRGYENNAKLHPQSQIEQIKQSIADFGFNDPLAIDENNVIIEGHGRFKAIQQLGYTEVPCIRLSHMTEQQKKAYILAHNKLTMNTDFDPDMLAMELDGIIDFDMEEYGFDIDIELDLPKEKGNPKEKQFDNFNLRDYDPSSVEGKYEMPVLLPSSHIPKSMIGFNYAKTTTDYSACVHFYLDDYQFERLWANPHGYMELLKKFDSCLTPNFSIYRDYPEAVQIYNTYRARLLGQIMQFYGIETIPIVYWSDEKSWEYCFDGLPSNSVLSVNTIGNNTEDSWDIWKKGMDELIRRKNPSTLLVYGNGVVPDYDFGGTNVVYYENAITKKWKGKGE